MIIRPRITLEAHRWQQNGDHPDDQVGELAEDPGNPGNPYQRVEGAVVRFFRHPGPAFAGDKIHKECGRTWHDHGWIDFSRDGRTLAPQQANVCPGDYVINDPTRPQLGHWRWAAATFDETYEVVG